MKRVSRILKKSSLKYIFGEIILIFIGISLAVWFNNWNSRSTTQQNTDIAIKRLTDEIQMNLDELKDARVNYNFLAAAYKAFKKVYVDDSNTVITTPGQFRVLMDSFPDYFRVKDSTIVNTDLKRYDGSTFINLELPEFTEIAWDTSKSIGITNELNYDCLYNLETTYLLQRRMQNEVNKAADALQDTDIERLMEVLEFLKQYGELLETQYVSRLDEMDNCS